MAGSFSSDRVRLRRHPERGRYDDETIQRILDEALVAHVGMAMEHQPYVIPVTFVRLGRSVYFHGAAAGRLFRESGAGVPLCFTATLLDGLVFARSAFHHSMNYRSVVVLGAGRLVEDEARKREVLDRLVDRFSPGRAATVRAPSETELRATAVIELDLAEASAKVRSGGPKDDPRDLELPCWAGVVPLVTHPGEPVSDEGCAHPPPSFRVR